MKEEPVDILDKHMNKIGQTMLKSEAHSKGLWHGGAHIWIYNSKGEVLMQLRSPKKIVRPNVWDVSVAGHIAAGKTPEETVVEEAKEELDLIVDPEKLVFIGSDLIDDVMPGGWKHRVFLWIYALKLDLNLADLTLEEEETSEVKWVPIGQLEEELNDPLLKQKYSPTRQSYDRAIEHLPKLLGVRN
ncbi:MAG: idi [Candidatus Saccharibacteria bacterium]|nr:idi [Candidatus Saccharibacteria bacterium]